MLPTSNYKVVLSVLDNDVLCWLLKVGKYQLRKLRIIFDPESKSVIRIDPEVEQIVAPSGQHGGAA